MILALLSLMSAPPEAPAVMTLSACRGDTTVQVESCLLNLESKAEAVLAKYQAAARARLARDDQRAARDSLEAKSAADFDVAEKAWTAYRDAECGAVFDYWSAGTIRVSNEELCRISLAVQHTHTIWREWLTYPDSTPSLLPEPPLSW